MPGQARRYEQVERPDEGNVVDGEVIHDTKAMHVVRRVVVAVYGEHPEERDGEADPKHPHESVEVSDDARSLLRLVGRVQASLPVGAVLRG